MRSALLEAAPTERLSCCKSCVIAQADMRSSRYDRPEHGGLRVQASSNFFLRRCVMLCCGLWFCVPVIRSKVRGKTNCYTPQFTLSDR